MISNNMHVAMENYFSKHKECGGVATFSTVQVREGFGSTKALITAMVFAWRDKRFERVFSKLGFPQNKPLGPA